MLRGKELDEAIESELKLMLNEGIEKSPISNTALYNRLIAKGVIRGKLSTLSSPERKKLIQKYIQEQLLPLDLNTKEQQQYVNNRTREALIQKNLDQKNEIAELKSDLNKNSAALVEMINIVKLKTNVQVDELLAPYLIADLEKKADLKIIE